MVKKLNNWCQKRTQRYKISREIGQKKRKDPFSINFIKVNDFYKSTFLPLFEKNRGNSQIRYFAKISHQNIFIFKPIWWFFEKLIKMVDAPGK